MEGAEQIRLGTETTERTAEKSRERGINIERKVVHEANRISLVGQQQQLPDCFDCDRLAKSASIVSLFFFSSSVRKKGKMKFSRPSETTKSPSGKKPALSLPRGAQRVSERKRCENNKSISNP